jgi:hypothetical protein
MTSIIGQPYNSRKFIYCEEEPSALTSWTALGTYAVTAGLVVAGAPLGAIALPAAVWGLSELVGSYWNSEEPLIQKIDKASVSDIEFPRNHPIPKTIYAGHPRVPRRYFPLPDFHKALFAEKYSEAVRLLMKLGANEIKINCVSGWSKNWAASLEVKSPLTSDIHLKARYNSAEGAQYIGKLEFEESKEPPIIPSDLVWYQDEPEWKVIAEGRLKHRLRSFEMSFNYHNDFGVNTGLEAKLRNLGLGLEVKCASFEHTIWTMSGTFPSSKKPIAKGKLKVKPTVKTVRRKPPSLRIG